MLTVLLLILKIIGIILASLLGLLLLALLLVLFVPVRYDCFGKKKEELLAKVRVSWLLRILLVSILYDGKNPVIVIRIFGYTVFHTGREKKVKKQRRRKTKTRETSSEETKEPSEPQILLEQDVSEEETAPIPKALEDKTEAPHQSTADKQEYEDMEEPSGQNGFSSILGIKRKLDVLRSFWNDESNRAAIKVVFSALKRIVKHIAPRKIEGVVYFGTGDPCSTGQILAAVGVFYARYGQHLIICPYFSEVRLEGELRIRGRIRLFHLLKVAFSVWRDKKVTYFRKGLRNLMQDIREA